LLDLGRKQRALERVRDQDGCLLLGKRGEPERRCVQLSAVPTRTALEKLGPRAADDEETDAAQPVDKLVDEVEQALVGQVEILEYQHPERAAQARASR
jgi:hypothetical protein